MIKRTVRRLTAAVLTMMLLLVGCAGEQTNTAPDTQEPPAVEKRIPITETVGTRSGDVKIEEGFAPYVIPWNVNASENAEKYGTLDFYFMSIGDMPFRLGTATPGKWGDACLVAFPNGELMLVDSGLAPSQRFLVQNLRLLGVEKLDYLLISHPHDDHIDGAIQEGGVLENIPVGKIFCNGVLNERPYQGDQQKLYDMAAERNIPVEFLKAGDTMEIGGVQIEILQPPEGVHGMEMYKTRQLNDYSIVMRMDYGETSALFTGDIYDSAEIALCSMMPEKLDVDLLKAPHHGGATSSTERFVHTVSPKITVATANVMMPEKVYERYKSVGADVYLDWCDGYIFISSDGKEMTVETSQERDTDIYKKYDQ